MTNAFISAIDARISENKLSASNIARLDKMRMTFANDKVLKLLDATKTDAAIMQANVYSIDKLANLLKVASSLVALHSLNDMNKFIFQTVMRCAEANETLTVKDAKDACSKSREVATERSALVCQNVKHVDESTVNAQHSSTLAALQALNILKSVARDSKEKHFVIDTKNAVYKALAKQFAV